MIDALLGYKGNQAAAKAARQTAEFNAQVAENEAVLLQRRKIDEEARMRQGSDRTVATQKVATAASGVQMSGSALQAMADSYFNTEMDALNIQYAADIEQTAKASEQQSHGLRDALGQARLKTASYQSLLAGAEKDRNIRYGVK